MKTKPFLYLIFCLIFSVQIYAQEKRIMISGNVTNDSIPLENVHIVNLSSSRGSLSNKEGQFKISVRENDTLMFSDIQYKIKKIIISREDIQRNTLNIILEYNFNRLEEVVIFKNKEMTNPLGIPNMGKTPLNQIERKLNYYSQASVPMVVLAMLLGQQGGIDDLYNIISGNRKKHRKLKQLLDQDKEYAYNLEKIGEVRKYFKDDFFTEKMQISKKDIKNFLIYCIPMNIVSLYEKKRYLEIMDIFIREKQNFISYQNENP